ncbi:hypothetical protein ABD89_05340 [Lysinibacillus sphaericus]|nr:hypothetical protein [Lysinibacillus sphaericus]
MLRKTTIESQCQMKKRYGLFQCPLYRHGGFLFGWISAICSTISPHLVKSQLLRVSKKYCQMGMVFSYNEERVGFK